MKGESLSCNLWRKASGLRYGIAGLLIGTMAVSAGVPSIASEIHASAIEAQQNELTVTGKVTDPSGEPLIGASVIEEGNTGNGSVTDVNGVYSLKTKGNATLIVQCMGYSSVTVAVNGRTTVNVVLTEDSELLEELVVIGYGAVRKVDLAGSVAVVDNKSFRDQPITQVSDALQGRVAGVQVISDGIPGGSVKIRVRGSNSINKSNEPLYVVDGMVRESGLEGINTEDIQSIQVLKDASSCAIYGSRGANGVVIVTTKTGHSGQTQITFDASVGISQATRLPDVMSTQEYAQALIDWYGVNQADVADYLSGADPGVDWVDLAFRTGVVQNYKLVLSKGGDKMSVYVSGNYLDHKGTLENTSYKRYAVKANLKADFTKWFSVALDINASRGEGKGASGLSYGSNALWGTFNYSPTMSVMDDDGNYNWDPYNSIVQNPYGTLVATENERRRDVFNGRVDLKFTILPGFTFTSSNAIDYYNSTTYSYSPETVVGAGKSSMSNDNSQRTMLMTTNNFTYEHQWNKHHLTATAVWEATKSETRAMGISGTDLQVASVGYWDVTNAASRDASNSYSAWSLLSGVARVMYNFDNRYMITGTFRADGTSRITNNKWGYFPSVAVAWTISNEKFMEGVRDKLSNLKLRVSYGTIGNQDIDPYSTLGLLSTTSTYFGTSTGTTGYVENTVATPDLKWEKTNQLDIGVDMDFLGGRISLALDYFNKQTSDALLETTLAEYLGGSSYMINAGKVENTGFDFAISADIFTGKDFTWNTSINGSYNKNEVKKLTAQEPIIYGGYFAGVITDATIIKEGEPIGTFYGYEWAGIDEEGYDTFYAADGSVTRSPSTDDRVVLGKSSPDWTVGWNNTFQYKNWSLNFLLNGAFGAQRMNALSWSMHSITGNSRMINAAGYADRIGTTMPDPTVANNYYVANSSKWVENADYVRLENLTLAYSIPKKVAKFADLRISLSVQNLFTITGYTGVDPAGFSFSSEGDRSNGIDTGTHPVPRTFTLGVRMNF